MSWPQLEMWQAFYTLNAADFTKEGKKEGKSTPAQPWQKMKAIAKMITAQNNREEDARVKLAQRRADAAERRRKRHGRS